MKVGARATMGMFLVGADLAEEALLDYRILWSNRYGESAQMFYRGVNGMLPDWLR